MIVDDNVENRDLLARQLQRLGHQIDQAATGEQALEMLERISFDLILLDIMMPGLNGDEVLKRLKAHPVWRAIPVIMISAVDDLESVVRCFELGAEDYIFKPFRVVILRARVNASLERKRLHDQEAAYLQALQAEQEKSERLLLNVLPKPIAERLKQSPGIIADTFPDVTVLFADIVDFTRLSARISPAELVALLNDIFSMFDDLAEKHGLEKIKTIGDAYMLVAGLSSPRPDHMEATAEMALDMQSAIARFKTAEGEPLSLRVGIHTGPVTAGVIGSKKFAYDLWGDTVNIASRMESHGLSNSIQVTGAVYQRLKDRYQFAERGLVAVKGKGEMPAYLLMSRQPAHWSEADA